MHFYFECSDFKGLLYFIFLFAKAFIGIDPALNVNKCFLHVCIYTLQFFIQKKIPRAIDQLRIGKKNKLQILL